MKTQVWKYAKKFFAVLLSVTMVLEAWGGLSFVSEAATSTTPEDGVIGTAFPTDYANYDFTQSDEYYITLPKQLVALAKVSKSDNFAGKTIHLAANIDIASSTYAETSYVGIGSADVPFCGTFDGHGYTISGLYSTESGLFLAAGSTTDPVTIKNFTVDNATISGTRGAVVVSTMYGNPQRTASGGNPNGNPNAITDVTVTNSTATFTGNKSGIILGAGSGDDDGAVITGCAVSETDLICSANTTTNVQNWGIIVGYDGSNGMSSFTDCTVTNSTISSTTCNFTSAGIIAGKITGSAPIEGCTITGCSITSGLSTTTKTYDIGGIIGTVNSSAGDVSNCTVTNTTLTTKGLANRVGLGIGNFRGGVADGIVVTGGSVNAQYSSADQAGQYGAIIGSFGNVKAELLNSSATGVTITCAGRANAIGGLVGTVEHTADGSVIDGCTGADLIMQLTYGSNTNYGFSVGGAIGRIMDQAEVRNTTVTNATVNFGSMMYGLGGFVGYVSSTDGASTFTNCSVSGSTFTQDSTASTDSKHNYFWGGFSGCIDGGATVTGCSVSDTTIKPQNRAHHYAALIGSTSSTTLFGAKKETAITISKCAVSNVVMDPKNNRNCNQFGGIVGYMTAGSSVSDCYVSTITASRNGNNQYIGGLIGQITSGTGTSVTNCYIEGCNFKANASVTTGSISIGSTGDADGTYSNLYYSNCSITGPSTNGGITGAKVSEANLTNGSTSWKLNTTNGTTTNSLIWTQGEASPVLTYSTTKGTVKVTYKNPSGDVVCYTDSTGNVPVVPSPDEGYSWETTETAFNEDTTVNVSYIGAPFPTDYTNYDFTQHTAYQINTVEQLVAFAGASKSYNFAGATVHLMANLDYAASSYATTSFQSIGSASVPFCGTFDGHGYTISGLYSTASGLFLAIGATNTPAIIQNFTIDKADISGAEGKAIVVSRFSGSPKDVTKNSQIIDVTVSNSTASFTGNNSGIIAGRGPSSADAITISGCKVTNTDLICTANSTTNALRYGIILARDTSGGYSSVTDCTVEGCDIISTTANIDAVGLVAGHVNGASPIKNCTVKDSTISLGLSTSTLTSNVGALVGNLPASAGNVTGNTVSGVTITTAGLSKNIGGLVGCFKGGTLANNKISDSTINLNYTSTTEFATLIGGAVGSVGLVDTTVAGSLTATNNTISNVDINVNSLVRGMGGFTGYVTGDAGSTFTGCKVTGTDIKTTALSDSANCLHVGGFVGCVDTASSFSGCSVASTNITMRGRTYYYAGFIGSTYSDTIASTAAYGAVTVDKCYVNTVKLATTNSRNCNEHAGLIGYLSEGSTVSNCYVTGFTGVANTNSLHVAGLIGYIPNVSAEATTVQNCLVTGATLNGKNSLGEIIGNCVATNATFKYLRYNNCSLNRVSGGSTYTCPGAGSASDAAMTSGELAWKLNTTGGSSDNSLVWTQGTTQPEFATSTKLATVRVSYLNPSGTVYRYTDASGKIDSIPTPDFGYAWENTATNFTVDTEVAVVESNSALNGKTILFLGDSITAATRDDATEKGWAGRIGTDYGAITTNAGWSGASVSTNKDSRIIAKMEENKNNTYDYVILHGGVNDAMTSAPLGTVSDSKNVADFDISTYAGALEELIYRAKEYFPTAKIGFIVNYQTPNSTWGGYTTGMAAYFHTAKQVCEKWDVPYIDLFFGSVEVEGKMLSYSYDILDVDTATNFYNGDAGEVHIGGSGYAAITPYIAEFIASIGVEQNANLFNKNSADNLDNTLKYNGTSKTDATAYANLFTTHMIPVERGDVLYFGDIGQETYILCLYDKDGNFVQQVRAGVDTDLVSATVSGTTTGYNGGSRDLKRFVYEVKNQKAAFATIFGNIDKKDSMVVYKNLEDTTGWPELKDKNLFDKDDNSNKLGTLDYNANTKTDFSKYSNMFTSHLMPVKKGDVVYWGGVGNEDYVLRLYDANGNYIQQIRNNKDASIGTQGLYYTKTGVTTVGYNFSTKDLVNFAYEVVNPDAAYMAVVGNITELDNLQVFVNLSNTNGWPGLVPGVDDNNPLKGKTALFVGDSITYGGTDGGWVTRIAKENSLLATNAGVSGSAISITSRVSSGNRTRILTQLENNKSNSYDYVIMHGGMNDAWDSNTVGTMSSSFDVADFDNTTYAGGLEELFYYAKQYYPDSTYGFIVNYNTPASTDGGNTAATGPYFRMAKQICEKWDIPYIDLFEGTVEVDGVELSYSDDILKVNEATNFRDAGDVHISATGYDIISPYISAWMRTLGNGMNGYSLTLDGKIQMNFYMELSDTTVNNAEAYLNFTRPDGTIEKMYVKDATSTDNGYMFTFGSSAKNMTDEVSVQLFAGDIETSEEYTYSIKTYADTIIADEATYGANAVALVKAMLNYGGYAQVHLKYNTDNLANADLTAAEKDLSSVTAESIAAYQRDEVSNAAIGKIAGLNLSLKSTTTLMVYFTLADGVDVSSLTFKVNDDIVVAEKAGSYYMIRIEGIAAHNLDTDYKITVSDGTNTLEANYSTMTYVYNILSRDRVETLQNVVAALRLYNLAADAY